MHARNLNITITPDTKVSDLIDFDYHLLLTLNRFNIPLGFGDKTVKEVCAKYNVDMDCFICIAQFFINPNVVNAKSFAGLNPASILAYLRNSHVYYLEERLPDIRQRLQKILENSDENSRLSTLKFFDDYFNEVREHMGYENNLAFPYIDELLTGKHRSGFSIDEFESHHSNIEQKITDLKHLIIKYMHLANNTYAITNILFDLYLIEEDLNAHCFIEDKALVPLVRKLEKQLKQA